MKRWHWFAAVLCLGLATILCWCSDSRDGVGTLPDRPKTPSVESAVPDSAPNPVRLISGSPLIEDYGDPEKTTLDDLKSLQAVLWDVPNLIKDFDRYFLPENREITRFLQGHNRDRLAWLPERHDYVNGDGELVDRQGTPVFFHRLGGLEFELRSGGPDGRLWTADDVVVK